MPILPRSSEGAEGHFEFRVSAGASVESSMTPSAEARLWKFSSEDEQWVATLATSYVSLETTAYVRFEDFLERLISVQETFQELYPVTRFTRVGLRYINVFDQEKFPGGWANRFNHHLLGPSADKLIGDSITRTQLVFVASEPNWTVTIRSGGDDKSYRLDLDHSNQASIAKEQVRGLVEDYHRRNYQLFRWAITNEMFQEMEPLKRE